MNKETLLSAVLLATAGLSNAGGALADVRRDAQESRTELLAAVFESAKTYKTSEYVFDSASGEYVKRDFDVRVRISFIRAGEKDSDYTFDGEGELDYEVIIERVSVNSDNVFQSDSTYYARRVGSVKYDLFDCDSTSRCIDDEEWGKTSLYVFKTPEGQAMRVKNKNISVGDIDEKEILFFRK